MKYIPKPIDTKDIELPEEVMKLAELLAKNTHEVWAAQRIKDGWQYGEVWDDKKKLHPRLVAYECLTESEKMYDRNTSLETLKVILKLGYKITRK
jgi:hypothetical protein